MPYTIKAVPNSSNVGAAAGTSVTLVNAGKQLIPVERALARCGTIKCKLPGKCSMLAILVGLQFLGLAIAQAQETPTVSKQAARAITNASSPNIPKSEPSKANSKGPVFSASGELSEFPVSLENKNAMRITLKASRGQATAGSSFGITAEIENTSSQPIYTIPAAIAMSLPPEIDSSQAGDL